MQNYKKKILVISSCVPYDTVSHAGGQTHNYYLKELNKTYDVYLISFGFDKEKDKSQESLARNNIKNTVFYSRNGITDKLKKIINLESSFNIFNRNGMICSNLDEIRICSSLEKLKRSDFVPDVIILEWLKPTIIINKIKKIFPGAYYIGSSYDVVFVGFKRKAAYFKGVKKIYWLLRYLNVKRKEIKAYNKCNTIMVQNKDNKDLLIHEGICSDKLFWLVPYYNNLQKIERHDINHDILFFGAMNRPENYLSVIWFIENIMPNLTDFDLRFVILGGNPPEELKKYSSDKVIVTGYVENVTDYFKHSLCFVAPLVLGAGIKVKILEALSSGIPVITNSIGIEGIDATPNKHYFHCETKEDYINAINSVISNTNRTNTMCIDAKRMITEKYSYEASYRKYIYLVNRVGMDTK